jgi:GH25 family lysozyme M1 (1,4-beta-N-acetylmuramidase)
MCEHYNPEDTFQHAQEWNTQTFEEAYPELANKPDVFLSTSALTETPSKEKLKTKKRVPKRKFKSPTTFVKCRRSIPDGPRLIQIKVIGLSNGQTQTDSDDEDNIIFTAQYIAQEPMDNVVDSAFSLINQISKSMLKDNF